MGYPCDLHTHTTRSDGSDTPRELIDNAAAAGLRVVAIADHDIRPPATVEVDGVSVDAATYAGSRGVRLLRGIEISCETDIEDTHIVCLGCDWTDPFFERLEADVVASKIESYRELVNALDARGMSMTWAEVLDNNNSPVAEDAVQKKMIFELMGRKGYVPDWKDAKLLVKKAPDLQLNRRKPDAVAVIAAVKRCGGVAILAHPYLIADQVARDGATMTRDAFIRFLIAAGLDGIEVRYTYDKTSYGGSMTKDEIAREVAERYAPLVSILSGGSDYHADHKKGVENARRLGEEGVAWEYFSSHTLLAGLN